jgi:signal transduction histidine kinase
MISLSYLMRQQTCAVLICAATYPFRIFQLNSVASSWLRTSADQPAQLAEMLDLHTSPWQASISQSLAEDKCVCFDGVRWQWPDGKQRSTTVFCMPLPADTVPGQSSLLAYFVDAPVEEAPSTMLDDIRRFLPTIPLPAWLFDARGRLLATNEPLLQLFHVETFEELGRIAGSNLAEIVVNLQPRLTNAQSIAYGISKGLSVQHMLNTQPMQNWTSDLRRELASEVRRSELGISQALRHKTITNQLLSLVSPLIDAEIMVRLTANPLYDGNGRIIGVLSIMQDVTDEMLLHGQRDAMLNIAGHDLRNPLTPAKIILQQLQRRLIRQGGMDREVDDIRRVLEQIMRIQNIADDIDAVAALSRGDPYTTTASDLVDISTHVAEQQMERHPAVRVKVYSSEQHIIGPWGRRNLEHVLTMLVAGAARRTPDGHTVAIKLRHIRAQIRIEITDGGDPLPAEQVEYVRQRLGLQGSALTAHEPVDIDLAIIQTMLSLYNSSLKVQARQRQGFTFWFALSLPTDEDNIITMN